MTKRAMYWCVSIALVMGGCVGGTIEGYVDNGSGVPTFAEFEQATYHEPMEDGVYIVNGDTPIPNVKQLREFYDALFHPALIVHQNGGSDAKWSSSQKLNLTYCVSNSFGSRKSALMAAMDQATTGGWEQAADVNFVHVTAQDGNCTGSNNNVLFDIRPTSGAPYLARAFFPGQGRSSRNVIVDTSAFNSGWPLAAVLAHELGHVLGFRHEHTRPEAGTCFEDNKWRPLTAYDSSSIMHYPQCNGSSGTLSFTQTDYNGAASLYGAPGGTTEPPPDDPGPTDPPPTDPPSEGTARTGNASGDVAQGAVVNFNALNVVPGSPLEVRMTGTGDADLYVRFDSQATTTAYDCRPYLYGSTETCSLDVPAGSTKAYIMVHGYESSSYNLSADWVEP